MTDRTLRGKVEKLQALQTEVDRLTEQAEALKNQIKREMESREVDELEAGNSVIRWKPVVSTRFDTKAFKAAHASLYSEYAAPTTTRRFTLVPA